MDQSWVALVERLGLPIFLIVFVCVIIWKLLPHVVQWFQTSVNTQKVLADAVPDIKESLHRLANDGQRTLDAIDRRTVMMDEEIKEVKALLSKSG